MQSRVTRIIIITRSHHRQQQHFQVYADWLFRLHHFIPSLSYTDSVIQDSFCNSSRSYSWKGVLTTAVCTVTHFLVSFELLLWRDCQSYLLLYRREAGTGLVFDDDDDEFQNCCTKYNFLRQFCCWGLHPYPGLGDCVIPLSTGSLLELQWWPPPRCGRAHHELRRRSQWKCLWSPWAGLTGWKQLNTLITQLSPISWVSWQSEAVVTSKRL